MSGRENTSGSDVEPNYVISIEIDPLPPTVGDIQDTRNNQSFDDAHDLGLLDGNTMVSGKLSVTRREGNSTIAQRTRIPESDYFRFEVVSDGIYRGRIVFDRLAHSP